MRINRLHISFVFLTLTVFHVNAQNKISKDGRIKISKMIDSIIFQGLNREILKDSTAIYAFNFKLDIVKNKNHTRVIQLRANDSLAYKLFPLYKKLSFIDYSALDNKKGKYTLIIPIIMGTYGSHQAKAENLKNGKIPVSLEMALNSATALFYPGPYNNQKDGASIALSYLGKKRTHINSEDLIYLFPQTFAVDMNIYH